MTDTSKKPREIWCLSNFNVTTQMPDGQIQDIRIAIKELKNSIINGEVTKLISLSEYQSLLEQTEKLREALEFYSKPFENDGVYIGNINFDRVHGNDCEAIGAFGIAGKKARQALEEYRKSKRDK